MVSFLSGDITIKKSKKGLTVFSFKFPVTLKFDEQPIEQRISEEVFNVEELLNNEDKQIPDLILKYLHQSRVEKFNILKKKVEKNEQISQ